MGPYCKFCDRRCFVDPMIWGLLSTSQKRVLGDHGYPLLATCAAGQEHDRQKLGLDYSEIRKTLEAPDAQSRQAD